MRNYLPVQPLPLAKPSSGKIISATVSLAPSKSCRGKTSRPLTLQDQCFSTEQPLVEQEKQLALYLRYQTTHDRGFQKCSDELRKLRNEKRKVQIGFASQKRQQGNENRKQELHKWAVMFAEAKFTNQRILNLNAEMAPPASVRDSEEYFQRLQEVKRAA